MRQKAKTLQYKIPMAMRGLLGILRMPRYCVLALAFALAFAFIMYAIINGGFYGPLLMSRLPFMDKLAVVVGMLQALGASFFTTVDGFLLLLVSVLQGVAFAVMVYTMRRNKRFDSATVGGGTLAMVATALGLGCVPCGTSLIMPIVTLFFSSSAYAAANTASVIVLVFAFLLSLYSLFRLGGIAYAHLGAEQYDNKEGQSEAA